LADFGLTSEGSSEGVQWTISSRGSPGYRAPELLTQATEAEYNNKVDIWALGVILYQLARGQKLFSSDAATLQYFQSETFEFDLGDCFDADVIEEMKANIREMLAKSPVSRPSASTLFERFCAYCHHLSAQAQRPSETGRTRGLFLSGGSH